MKWPFARAAENPIYLDGTADRSDFVSVELQDDVSGGIKVYVHVNGRTVLRIGKVMSASMEDNRQRKGK